MVRPDSSPTYTLIKVTIMMRKFEMATTFSAGTLLRQDKVNYFQIMLNFSGYTFPNILYFTCFLAFCRRYCSCREWMHTGKPCQHGLVVIIAQQSRSCKMEDFVDDYFSVEMFRKAYEGRIEQLEDKFFWPQVDITKTVVTPLQPRQVGRQRKNRFKS
jgi:hypothetical protein